jgi:ABC-2 type transport system ATP-binding protein
VIEARQLTKRFGARAAVEEVSLRVEPGEVVGFLGPNGAGKTTTLRVLAGVFPPSAGQALIDGHDVGREPLLARRRLGYAPERPALHLEMTVAGMLDFAAAMKDVGGWRERSRTVGTALEQAGLASVERERIGTLSKGYRQRVGLALALVGEPPALLLDEPTAGLDPEQSADTRRLVRALGERRAVLVSSHALAEVEATCDRVVILHRGRVLAADRPARLAARLRPASRVDVEAAAPAEALAAALALIPGVARVDLLATHDGHSRCRVELVPGRDVRSELAKRITDQGWGLLALAPVETSLEESFLALVAEPDRAEPERHDSD